MKNKEELASELVQLKNKYGKVATLLVPLDEDDTDSVATLYLKKADRVTRAIMSKLVGGDNTKLIEATLKNLHIGGDELAIVLNNDDALFSCDEALAEMLQVQKALLKKN